MALHHMCCSARCRSTRPSAPSLPVRRSRSRRDRDRGQAVPLVAAALALVAVVALGVVRIGVVATDRARAHTAADAAALAGAIEGRAAADEVARDNGGTVMTFERGDGEVEVRVRVREVEAVARARLVR